MMESLLLFVLKVLTSVWALCSGSFMAVLAFCANGFWMIIGGPILMLSQAIAWLAASIFQMGAWASKLVGAAISIASAVGGILSAIAGFIWWLAKWGFGLVIVLLIIWWILRYIREILIAVACIAVVTAVVTAAAHILAIIIAWLAAITAFLTMIVSVAMMAIAVVIAIIVIMIIAKNIKAIAIIATIGMVAYTLLVLAGPVLALIAGLVLAVLSLVSFVIGVIAAMMAIVWSVIVAAGALIGSVITVVLSAIGVLISFAITIMGWIAMILDAMMEVADMLTMERLGFVSGLVGGLTVVVIFRNWLIYSIAWAMLGGLLVIRPLFHLTNLILPYNLTRWAVHLLTAITLCAFDLSSEHFPVPPREWIHWYGWRWA